MTTLSYWAIDQATATLVHGDAPNHGIPTERFKTPNDLKFWVRLLAPRDGITTEILVDLVAAFADLNWELS